MARGQKTDVSLHVIEVYVAWINGCLAELSVRLVSDITNDLHDGLVLGHLVHLLTGCNVIQNTKPSNTFEKCENVQSVIDFMKGKGIDVYFEAGDVVAGDLKSILDIVWLIILHFEIHSANRAAYQRTVSMGKRFLLEWFAKELPDIIIDTRGSFVELLENGVYLMRVISKYCVTVDATPSDIQKVSVEDFTAALEAAFTYLDFPSKIIRPSAILDASVNEYALIIYVAVMRRKISKINGEEPHKGWAKLELTPPVTPMKQKTHSTPEMRRATPTRAPHVLRSPSSKNVSGSSPLSPSALKNLVEQQAMSNAAIQALQERIQASPYQTATPRLQKKLPTFSASAPMAPTEGVTESTTQQNNSKTAEKMETSHGLLALDQNDNFLLKGGESQKKAEVTNGRRNLYSDVDKQFLEFMLDAVSRGYVPDEFVEGKTPPSSELSENKSREELLASGDSKNGPEAIAQDVDRSGLGPGESAYYTESNSAITDSELIGGNASNESGECGNNKRSSKAREGRSQFFRNHNGENISFTDQETTGSTERAQNEEDVTKKPQSSVELPHSTERQEQQTVPNSLADQSVNGCLLQSKPLAEAADRHCDSGRQSDTSSHGDEVEDDPFMLYLDSIEHSALKFKLQVERAKVDTLQTLKNKLEEAYEGTPLEEIPSKFSEKLQEAIAQLTSDDVMEKSGLVEKQDDTSEKNAELVDYLRNELDSVAVENFRLNQQLDVLKEYEASYLGMKDEVDVLNEEVVEIRSKYEEKKEESEFLAERVDQLEKGIFNMRVEYEDQVRVMREETLQLQMMLTELQNETDDEDDPYILNENMQEIEETLEDNEVERDNMEYFSLQSELESMRFRLEESERRNKALKTATAADQSVIKCLEGKVADLESALDKSHDDNSRYLSELQEAQRQHSSDRAKLSSYHDETEALQRENKLLKSSLKIAENEIEYLQGKGKRSGEPWKDNRKQIWREIRELEKILKDVHKEKRSIEKKYVSFKHETDIANNSLTSYSASPPQSPESESNAKANLPRGVSLEQSPAASEDSATNDYLPHEIATPPQKVQSWIEDLHTLSGVEASVAKPTPMSTQKSGSSDSVQSPTGSRVTKSSPLSQELQELRNHVGSLEAEKAAIVKELTSLRGSRFE